MATCINHAGRRVAGWHLRVAAGSTGIQRPRRAIKLGTTKPERDFDAQCTRSSVSNSEPIKTGLGSAPGQQQDGRVRIGRGRQGPAGAGRVVALLEARKMGRRTKRRPSIEESRGKAVADPGSLGAGRTGRCLGRPRFRHDPQGLGSPSVPIWILIRRSTQCSWPRSSPAEESCNRCRRTYFSTCLSSSRQSGPEIRCVATWPGKGLV